MSKHVPVFILRKDAVAQMLADRPDGDGGGAFAEIIDRAASDQAKAPTVEQFCAEVAQFVAQCREWKN
mgnify:CR=1 FL=1